MKGRPSKLTMELQEEVVKHLRTGNYIETVSALVGISKNTFYDWLKRGAREIQRVEQNSRARIRKDEQKYVDFSDAVKKAMAHAEVRDVTLIAKAGDKNWQASAWRLERKHPDKWGRKERQTIEHMGKDGGAIETKNTLDLSALSDKELAQLERLISKGSEPDD